MRSNYKKLGPFISPHGPLNEEMEVKELLGISNQKFFQKSHTNTVGIDLSTYRIVRTNQFAYNRATTRNGEKISIALRQGEDCIVSPSYRIFKVNDENELLSEYLFMWFKRPEFDRYVRFKSHGSAHEFFEYDQMGEVELPIPSPTKQREIVNEYNVIQNRIALNNRLIKKLEETAQAIYKQWFVDFEFPDEKGKPYKSGGGEMVDSELGEIPKRWDVKKLADFSEMKYGKMLDAELFLESGFPVFSGYGVRGYYSEYMFEDPQILVLCRGVSGTGEVKLSPPFSYITNLSIIVEANQELVKKMYLFYFLKNGNLRSLDSGSAQSQITTGDLYAQPILVPSISIQSKFNDFIEKLMNKKELHNKVISALNSFQSLLLSKLATIEN